ncbi:hypothetical protein V8C35DRAFT_113970 [Trichoderma chlorosporum]
MAAGTVSTLHLTCLIAHATYMYCTNVVLATRRRVRVRAQGNSKGIVPLSFPKGCFLSSTTPYSYAGGQYRLLDPHEKNKKRKKIQLIVSLKSRLLLHPLPLLHIFTCALKIHGRNPLQQRIDIAHPVRVACTVAEGMVMGRI